MRNLMQKILVPLLICYTLLQIGITTVNYITTLALKVAGHVLYGYGIHAYALGQIAAIVAKEALKDYYQENVYALSHLATIVTSAIFQSWNPNRIPAQQPYVPKRLRQKISWNYMRKTSAVRALVGVGTYIAKCIGSVCEVRTKWKGHQKSPIYYRKVRPRKLTRLPKSIQTAYIAHIEENAMYFGTYMSKQSQRAMRQMEKWRKRNPPPKIDTFDYEQWRLTVSKRHLIARNQPKKGRDRPCQGKAFRIIRRRIGKATMTLPMHGITCLMARKPATSKRSEADKAVFDTDSFLIAIDSACSYCITNNKRHLTDVKKINVSIKGIGGQRIVSTLKGTAVWTYEDDDGVPYEHRIPNTHLDENSPYCLLSPQHIAQLANDHKPKPCGTYGVIHDKAAELYWDQQTRKRTIVLDPATNIPLMRSAPGFTKFHAFNTQIEKIDGRDSTTAATITDDESSVDGR